MQVPTLLQQGVETIPPPMLGYYEPYGAIHSPETSLASEDFVGFYYSTIHTKSLCDKIGSLEF